MVEALISFALRARTSTSRASLTTATNRRNKMESSIAEVRRAVLREGCRVVDRSVISSIARSTPSTAPNNSSASGGNGPAANASASSCARTAVGPHGTVVVVVVVVVGKVGLLHLRRAG